MSLCLSPRYLLFLSKYIYSYLILSYLIWSCLISGNTIIKNLAISAVSSGSFTFGDNYRYLSYKYNIDFHIWMLSLYDVITCISLYMSIHNDSLYSAHGKIFRDLCLVGDNHYQRLHMCVDATKWTYRRVIKMIVNRDYIKQSIICAKNFFG